MSGWWMSGWTDGRADRWIHEWKGGWRGDGQIHEWMDGWRLVGCWREEAMRTEVAGSF